MTLLAFDLPTETAELALWLEERLVGLDLRQLVTELSAVHAGSDAAPAPIDATEWLGEWKGPVLTEGLRVLSLAKLGELLRQPGLLGSLQELALLEGGRYWEDLSVRSSAIEAPFSAGRDRLTESLREDSRPIARSVAPEPVAESPKALIATPSATTPSATTPSATTPSATTPSATTPSATMASTAAAPSDAFVKSYRALAVFLAIAACLVFTVTHYLGSNRAQVAWGWNSPGAIDERAPAPVYLERLAAAGREWFDQRPTSAADVRQRIRELRAGCERVIAAPHAPLQAADQQWLVERCQKWREKFDAQLAALDANGDPLAARTQIDETVNKLIGALQERAKHLATG